MRKEWLWVGIASVLLSACIDQPPAPQQQVQQTYSGPVEEIGGAEPRYEPLILTLIRIIKLMASPTVLSKIRRISLR